ncbi:MAG: DUF6356 family protein [Steroidobacteraceae bacterium]
MSIWHRLFREHPAAVDESYWQHLGNAAGFGFRMIWGGIVCLVHAVIPGVYCTKASEMIGELHERMITNRRRVAETSPQPLATRRAA